jgi:hypothetical protein
VHVLIFRFGALPTGCLMMIRPVCGRKVDCGRRNAEDRRTAVIGWLTVESLRCCPVAVRSSQIPVQQLLPAQCPSPPGTYHAYTCLMCSLPTPTMSTCVCPIATAIACSIIHLYLSCEISAGCFVARSYRRVKEFILSPLRPYLSTLQ